MGPLRAFVAVYIHCIIALATLSVAIKSSEAHCVLLICGPGLGSPSCCISDEGERKRQKGRKTKRQKETGRKEWGEGQKGLTAKLGIQTACTQATS